MIELLKDLDKLRPLISRQDKWKFVFLLGLMLIGSILEAIGIGAIPAFVSLVMRPSTLSENRWVGEWFADMPDQINLNILFWASVLLLTFIVFKNLFLAFVFYIQARIVAAQRVQLADRMFRVYQSAPYDWFLQRSSSDFIRSIQTDTEQVLVGFVLPFLNMVMATIMSAVIVAVLFVSTSNVTLWALLVSAIGFLIVVRVFRRALRKSGKIAWVEHKELVKSIQQGFGAMVDTRIIGCEAYLRAQHRNSLFRMVKALIRQQVIGKVTPYAMEAFAVLGLLTILYILVMTTENLSTVLPLVALLGVVMVRFKQLATQVAVSINLMNAARAYLPGIVEDLKELEKLESIRRAGTSDQKLIDDFSTLRLENVSYSYPNTQNPAVKNISLEVNQGESIAFVGETGCGKSTLANLILGLLVPQKGQITVNGYDIHHDMDGWREQLGYIPQSVFLIDDTISANVAFGCPSDEINEETLWRALDTACLSDFVKSLPDGLGTIVGEAGVRLSGGQRQRLGIARAIYPNPEVLVMDEATSALDSKTEESVMQAIQNLKKGRTLIMIAHRLSTVESCDRLYYLGDGHIKAFGKYSELLQKNVGFRELAIQSSGSHSVKL